MEKIKKTNEIATRSEAVTLTSPSDVMAFATSLKDLIVQNRLYTSIKGRNYVNVEGWQIAGAFTGTFPIVEKVENLSDGTNYKYRAEVSLRDQEGNKVGYGVAICTNKEPGKTNFDEYAVASMAQTRAVGKAYRMKIGWLLKVAGYETTPAEEMNTVDGTIVSPTAKDDTHIVEYVLNKLDKAESLDELRDTYVALSESIRKNESVVARTKVLKLKFKSAEAKGGEDGRSV